MREQADLRKIFERKMQERQEFLDRYFVFGNERWTPPRDYSRANGLVEDIRQAYFHVEEQIRLLRESAPTRRSHRESDAIELPRLPTGNTGAKPQAAPAPGAAPPPAAAPPAAAPPAPPAPPPAAPAPGSARPTHRAPVVPNRQPRTDLDSPVVIRPMARSVNLERME